MAETLDEFKQKVRETTKRYAVEHELCHVVDEYLGELGLPPVCEPQKVPVRLAIQADVTVSVDKESWEAMTEEQQKAHLMKNLYLPHNSSVRVYTQDSDVATVETPEPRMVLAGVILDPTIVDGLPLGHYKGFTSDEGRVAHIFPDATGDLYTRGLCGVEVYRPRPTSHRDSGQTCARCTARAEAMIGGQ